MTMLHRCPKPATLSLVAVLAMSALAHPVWAQTTSTGSVGCTAITQASTNGMTARVGSDDTTIQPPQSVKNMTCLGNFFNGVGLNLVTNLINPANILQAIQGQICSLIQQQWSSMLGSAQCGLTVTGFNMGFGGIGGGLSCPKLSFGGGGPPIASVGIGTGSSSGSGLYINGTGTLPSGYTVPNVPPGSL